MTQKLIVGPISKGFKANVLPFNVDNDAFPTLINAYQWRGRIKRKRGSRFLSRLTRYFDSTNYSYTGMNGFTTVSYPQVTYFLTLTAGKGNLFGPYTSSAADSFSLETTGNILPGTVTIIVSGDQTYTDPSKDGTLMGSLGGTGTINYGTGDITTSGGGSSASVTMWYFPVLPVLGIENFDVANTAFPLTIAFDQVYSYNIPGSSPANAYDVSFYKDPSGSGKTNPTPVRWNGNNYQQFFTINYEGAFWATNGIPYVSGSGLFDSTKLGVPGLTASITQNSSTQVTATFSTNHGLVIGDFVFINETNISLLNFLTGTVSSITSPTIVVITFTGTNIGAGTSSGFVVYLTNVPPGFQKDCIRWYDGDPTNAAIPPSIPALTSHTGWVNFCPPLSFSNYSIAELPVAQYYLAGAKLIWPYKDRLLFIGPVIQTSSGTKYYLQDTIIWSQNGTPYYTCTFNADPTLVTTTFNAVLTPSSAITTTATASAWWEDFQGYGGFKSAGLQTPILTIGNNEDVLILGFASREARMVYTSNDLDPFEIYTVNSEYGSTSSSAAITVDRGIYSIGRQGIVLTSQHGSQRIDLEIPDQIFEFNLQNNGTERVTGQRDFINEWIYFSFSGTNNYNVFNNQTLFFNYRDNSWAVFYESYTTYGTFRASSGLTWNAIDWPWNTWNEPWNSGVVTVLQPYVVGGTTQGFIMLRDEGTTREETSIEINSITGSSPYLFTSYNHQLNNFDYITISDVINDSTNLLNGQIFQVINVTANTFTLNPNPVLTGFTYVGGGLISRMYIPLIQTRQFPIAWEIARKVRLGWQEYLFTITPKGQLTLYIYLSQNQDSPYNGGPIVPQVNSTNNSLIYSTILYTSPQLYMQNCNNLLLGKGNGSTTNFTFSYYNLFSLSFNGSPIVAGSVFISTPLATFQDDGTGTFTVTGTAVSGTINYNSGVVSIIFSVAPLDQTKILTNFQYSYNDIQNPIASSQDQIWHRMNTSLLGDTVQLGFTLSDLQMTDTTFSSQFAEIELHSFVINISPSSLLA